MMGTDKLLHVLCGYVIAVTIGMWLPWLGAVAGIVAAFGKEFLWDRLLKRGTFEWADINATLDGVLIGFALPFLEVIYESMGIHNRRTVVHRSILCGTCFETV